MEFEDLQRVCFQNKVMDCLQFFESAVNYLHHAGIHSKAFLGIKEKERQAYTEWSKKLINEGSISYFPMATVPFFDIPIPSEYAFNIITRGFFQSLNSYVDSYSQFLNRAVLGNEAFPLEKTNPEDVAKKLKEIAQSAPNLKKVLSTIIDLTKTHEYKYLTALNNVMKHHYVVDISTITDLSDGQYNVKIKGFRYKTVHYQQKELQDVLINNLTVIMEFHQNCTNAVIEFLNSVVSHPYTENRFQELEFANEFYEADGKRECTYIQYLTIDFDPACVDCFQILSVVEDNGRYNIKNSISDVIVLRNYNRVILGVLNAVEDLPDEDDVQLFTYRRYEKRLKEPQMAFFNELTRSPKKILLTKGEIKIIND